MTDIEIHNCKKKMYSDVTRYINEHINLKDWPNGRCREILKEYLYARLMYDEDTTGYAKDKDEMYIAKSTMLPEIIESVVDDIKE